MDILRNVRAFPRRRLLILIVLAVWCLLTQGARPGDIDRVAGDCAFLLLLLIAGAYLIDTVRMMRTILKLGSAAWIIVVVCDLLSQVVMWNGIHQRRLLIDCILLLLLLLFRTFPSLPEFRKHLLQFAPLALSALILFPLIYCYAPDLFGPLGRTWIDVLPVTAWAYLFAHLAEACRIPKPAMGVILLIVDVCIKWPSDVAGFLVAVVIVSVASLWLNTQRKPRRPLQLNQPETIRR